MFADSIEGVISQVLLKKKEGKGRVAVHEILVATKAIRSLIRESKTYQIESVLQTGSSVGMCTMDQSLTRLVNASLISEEDALSRMSTKKNKDQIK